METLLTCRPDWAFMVKSHSVFEQTYPMLVFPRLLSAVDKTQKQDQPVHVAWRLMKVEGVIQLHIMLETEVALRCERCESLFVEVLACNNVIKLVHAMTDKRSEFAEDMMLFSEVHSIGTMLEDELLLALPLLPQCGQAQCVPVSHVFGEPVEPANPFALLKHQNIKGA